MDITIASLSLEDRDNVILEMNLIIVTVLGVDNGVAAVSSIFYRSKDGVKSCIAVWSLVLTKNVYCDTNYRLNTTIRPVAYSIAITPYFDTNDENAFTFDGEVDITFITESATSQIKLHSENLTFDAANISVANGANILNLEAENALEFDYNYTFAYINLQDSLQVGVEYTLRIVYRGPIRQDLNGFYRNYYIERGVRKWLGATQMEPTHARKVFPCFDEPDLKATFTLTIDRPESYQPSRANTKLAQTVPLSNGYVREVFHPTPVMSTYLVAFLVSEFQGVETLINSTDEFGVFTRPEAVNQTDYTLDFGVRVVNALGEYFGVNFYATDANLKLDHVALPDFRAGAMENWGLVKYREALLLYVPEHSTPYYKYRVAQIMAHETTHMWFGNLVTCHWWSNTWLNEGFANYFQDYITAQIESEVGSANILVTGSVYQAYTADESPSAVAITNENVNSPAEISGHFGTITYQKAGSVIRMMHHLIGDDAFRMGLNNYLIANQFSSGYPDRLYAALHVGVTNHNSLDIYENSTIAEVMSSWISQPGHPVLQVDIDYNSETVVLTQKRFYINSSYSSNETYAIPITYTIQSSANFTNTKPVFIMKDRTHQFSLAGINETHDWVIFNIQETGLYRVNYDDHSWDIISQALQGSERERIHHLNRAKIVNDLFAFVYADEVSFNRLQDVLKFLENETDYSVWLAAIQGLNRLWHSYHGSDAQYDIATFTLNILESGISKLGYEVRASDDFESLRNRMQLLYFACNLGLEECRTNTANMFRGLRENGTEISPSLRPVAYCNGLRLGDANDYDFLWQRMVTTNIASEASIIGDVLGCSSDEGRLRRFLVSMLEENSPIRVQDLTVPIASVLSDYSHLPIVLDELRANFSLWSTIYPSMETVLSTVASALHTEEDFNQFEEFLTSCGECSEQLRTRARSTANQARAATDWANNHKELILTQLRSSSDILAPSMLIITGLLAILGKL